MKENIFKDLFVLEVANNHWGSLKRGKEIVRQFAKVVKKHNVKAAINCLYKEAWLHSDGNSI